MASARFLGKCTGRLRKDLDWKTAEPRDGWADATTNARGGPRVYSLVEGSLISDRLRVGPAELPSRHTIQSIVT
jgi:hypothetical protein